MTVDRDSPVPLYHQLRQLLVSRIESGEWEPGDMVATEEQLQEQYDVSRITVRQALKEMELEGLITRMRGKGTFVAQPKLEHSPEPRLSLTNYLREQGMEPGWQVLSAEVMPAPADVADRLEIDAGREAYCLQRLRLANDEPIGYHIAYVSPVCRDAVNEELLLEGGSLRYLRGSGYLTGSTADRVLEAISAPKQVAEWLGVNPGAPLLMIRRLVTGKNDVPLEDFKGMYRGDRFQYHIRHLPAVNPINA